MTKYELLRENNAILKVLLKNQAAITVVLEEAVDKLNEDMEMSLYRDADKERIQEIVKRQFEIREEQAIAKFKGFMALVKMVTIDPYNELI